jgi:predicted nucleotidyltransferase
MKRTIEKVIAFAVQIAEPDEIILFGSMAQGTHDVYSDLDILIVNDEQFQKKQITARVEQFAQQLALSADVLIYSKSDLKKAIDQPHSFVAGICQSGKIVYQKGGKYFDF